MFLTWTLFCFTRWLFSLSRHRTIANNFFGYRNDTITSWDESRMTVQFKSILLCCCMLEQHIIYFLRLMVFDVDVNVALSELCNGSNPIGSNRVVSNFNPRWRLLFSLFPFFLLRRRICSAGVKPSNHRYHSLWFIGIAYACDTMFVRISNSWKFQI